MHYRIYFIDRHRHIQDAMSFMSASDALAAALARCQPSTMEGQLWRGCRCLCVVPPAAASRYPFCVSICEAAGPVADHGLGDLLDRIEAAAARSDGAP